MLFRCCCCCNQRLLLIKLLSSIADSYADAPAVAADRPAVVVAGVVFGYWSAVAILLLQLLMLLILNDDKSIDEFFAPAIDRLISQ